MENNSRKNSPLEVVAFGLWMEALGLSCWSLFGSRFQETNLVFATGLGIIAVATLVATLRKMNLGNRNK